jgi:hypothetical protein
MMACLGWAKIGQNAQEWGTFGRAAEWAPLPQMARRGNGHADRPSIHAAEEKLFRPFFRPNLPLHPQQKIPQQLPGTTLLHFPFPIFFFPPYANFRPQHFLFLMILLKAESILPSFLPLFSFNFHLKAAI